MNKEQEQCGYIYKWTPGSSDITELPCFWTREEHPEKSKHEWVQQPSSSKKAVIADFSNHFFRFCPGRMG